MRCNVGVNPNVLADQHLLAEFRELNIVYGSLKSNNFQIKSKIPDKFSLQKGHINFFKNKLVYLKRRHDEIVKEMHVRGFKTEMKFYDFEHLDFSFKNDWTPTLEDSMIVRQRIVEKIKMKPEWYRLNRKNLAVFNGYCQFVMEHDLFYV